MLTHFASLIEIGAWSGDHVLSTSEGCSKHVIEINCGNVLYIMHEMSFLSRAYCIVMYKSREPK
jgi:hypothetical protein